MQLFPSFDRFKLLSERSGLVPVWREFLFDVDTAVTAYAKLAEPPFGFLLESVVGGEQWARYTFLGTRPAQRLEATPRPGQRLDPDSGWTDVETDDPLSDLDARLRARVPADVPGLPRLWGGAVGYFGYDVVRQIERLPNPPEDDLGIPDGLFMFTDVVLAIDNLKGRAMAIAAVPVEPGRARPSCGPPTTTRPSARRSWSTDWRSGTLPPPSSWRPNPTRIHPFTSPTTRAEYMAGVERIREYIKAGDAFQVVLSQRLGFDLEATPFEVYRGLRSLNPSPYLYFLELEDLSLVGSSPEVLVRVEDGKVIVRPIAGTGPAAPRRKRSRRSSKTCCPTRRSSPSTACSSTSAATTSGGWRSTGR
jgi:anthranilate synthase component I